MANKKLKISFFGGTEDVTGANFLIEGDASKGETILVDCGLFQGNRVCEQRNYDKFPYDPATANVLFVTHAHLDHVGRIPKLVHEGFRGRIYSTPPTKEIAEVVLEDSMGILEKEAKHEGNEMLYNADDIKQAMSLWHTVNYHDPVKIGDLSIVLRDSGHILGSAMIEITYGSKKIVFTGDLGNSPAPLLRDTEAVSDATYVVMESVYGDRNHEDKKTRRDQLEDAIEETMKRGGVLIIPAFSIERTQELLFEIENMMENSRIPLVPVFLDSPMAIKVTEVYKRYESYFNHDAKYIIDSGDGIFKFPQFHETVSTEESRRIDESNQRKIVMAGSGMSNGGRIIHHEKKYLPDPKSTLLLVGYQEVGSLGRQLQDGARMVKILGEIVPVNAKVINISGYSAHKDSEGLFNFVKNTADTVRRVFVVMGEPKSSLFLVQRIRDYLGVDAIAPHRNQVIEIEL
ncbi:MAG: MBL fold metallo-hydrolase [bacterium]